ncbi:hypothetical protein ABIB40_002836 [Pedobacter sp. UYP30]|uniref:hypothetical protein n=1 Tax=Pedobacter sp. UYP30 TaxID=1756400 RepID=UPI00339225AB
MENRKNPKKKILKPSVIHDDVPKPEEINHLAGEENYKRVLPENPERNYHHGVNHIIEDNNKITRADDDIWNGEDA